MAAICHADSIDSLENVLQTKPQIQEKIYIHTDNNTYFVGDTIWYKAYVLRSDDLKPTNMSKLLYVELLSPDGIVVERQRVIISGAGSTCGQFELRDSLYSGYYELRAYTRWQLNFNVSEKKYNMFDERKFYSKQMAADYFRDYEGLYSRVLPVYSKPREEGEYDERYMFSRPKQRILKEHVRLHCSFYPEGGQLVDGLPSRIAFELFDNNGEAISVNGKFDNGVAVQTLHNGRGIIDYNPANGSRVTFHWNDKDWHFSLPKAQSSGCTINYYPENGTVTVTSKGINAAAMALTCRGKLQQFVRINGGNNYKTTIDRTALVSGINEIIIYDNNAQPIASRLFFVNNNDMGGNINVGLTHNGGEVTETTTLSPFEKVDIALATAATDESYPRTVSLSVRDARTDDPTYNDGNILTDMLLSGDLKGFVAYPAYYFEADDAEHRRNLDLLLMVQGWRKYTRIAHGRYLPETSLAYEGRVLKVPTNSTFPDFDNFSAALGSSSETVLGAEAPEFATDPADAEESEENLGIDPDATANDPEADVYEWNEGDPVFGGRIRKPVIVEAEVSKDGEVAGVTARTNAQGFFRINLPPYYDYAILRLKAYAIKDSVNKNMQVPDKHMLNAEQFPDYYVKQEMFFPIFSKPYSWYQVNAPEVTFVDEDDELIPENSRLAGDHRLQTVVVKSRRRGKRAIDFNKPAVVRDAYDLYNDVTDYGLSFGTFNVLRFPLQLGTYLYGNMGRYNQFNIRAMLEETSFYRNYSPYAGSAKLEYDKNMAPGYAEKNLKMNRIKNVRLYTDYELRTDSGAVETQNSPDVTMVFESVPDDGKRYVYRDRRYVYPGITYAEEYYRRDYSDAALQDPKDYRRTLYWNPNAKLDDNGQFVDVLYNNSRETRVRVSAAGVSPTGKLFYSK